MNELPAYVIALPLAGAAILIAILDRFPRRVTESIAIAISAAALAGTVAVLAAVLRGGPIVLWIGGWHPGNRVGLGIVLGVDIASACVALLVALVVLAATIFCLQYFEEVGTIFYVLILAMLGSMIAFAYAGDLFNLFVWYEVFSVAAYALSTYHGETESAFAGALQFALTNTVAGLFFLVGIILLEGRTGELDLVAIAHSLAASGRVDVLVTTALAFIAVGLFTRGALAPMQFWFDEVHATAPAPLSAILSGAMAPIALYGFARIYHATFAEVVKPSHVLVAAFLCIGALSAIFGTVMTLRESRLKRKLAQATVAHSGVALCAIATFGERGLAGASIYEGGYALSAASLFFAIAILKWATGEHDVKMLRGAGRTLPLTAIAFGLCTLSNISLWPGMRAIGDTGTPHSAEAVMALAAIVAAGTGGAFAAVFVRVFCFAPRGVSVRKREDGVPWFLISPALGLASIGTLIVVLPASIRLASQGAAGLAAPSVYARAIMTGARFPVVEIVPHAAPQTLLWPVFAAIVAAAILVHADAMRRIRIALMKNVAFRVFNALDHGDSGAYIAWIAGTVVALCFFLSLAIP